MKNQGMFLVSAAFASFLFFSCGSKSGGTSKNNEYLGKVPSMVESYNKKMEELEEKSKKATKLDEAFEIQQKMNLEKENLEKEIKAEVATMNLPKSLPIDGNLEYDDITIKEITLTGMSRTTIVLGGKGVSKKDRAHLFGYFSMQDQEGNLLGKEKRKYNVMGLSGNFREVKAGDEIELMGAFPYPEFMGNFAKIVFVTKEEYDSNQ